MNRRMLLGGAAAVVAAAGGLAWKLGLLRKHYPPTPYDDLLGQIVDRAPAIKLGRAELAAQAGFDPAVTARRLRGGRGLAIEARRDCADGRTVEVAGWMIPLSLALYSALAAKVTPA